MAAVMVTSAALILLLASPVGATRTFNSQARRISNDKPFVQDCWKKLSRRTDIRSPALKRHLALVAQTSNSSGAKLPGAGTDPEAIVPFQTVLKDGYLNIACAKDYLFLHGDKFGDGKDSYELGKVSNVSIVHYTDIIAKEDRKEMTPEVCFEFCRAVPDMLVFGITNGRDCYCSPYFKNMASDSSDCDEVCDGDKTQICGGKTKSSIFEMHSCNDAAEQLKVASGETKKQEAAINAAITNVTTAANDMQAAADEGQASLGKVGDPEASDLMQTAKVFAGKLLEATQTPAALSKKMKAATSEADGLSVDAKDFKSATKAEALVASMGKMNAQAEDSIKDLGKLYRQATPKTTSLSEDAAEQYRSIMYFVDKEYVKDPTTCTGKAVAKPITGVTLDECAHACDAQIHGPETCAGFSFYDLTTSLCFLFSEFTEVKYYTECTTSEDTAFLQRLKNRRHQSKFDELTPMTCMAKFSKFDGTNLTPNVKCDGCLKKAVKAARCPDFAAA